MYIWEFICYRKRGGNIWYTLIPINDFAFTLPSYLLKSKDIVEIDIDWEYGYGKLEKGKYRIVKEVNCISDDYNPIIVAAEFKIE